MSERRRGTQESSTQPFTVTFPDGRQAQTADQYLAKLVDVWSIGQPKDGAQEALKVFGPDDNWGTYKIAQLRPRAIHFIEDNSLFTVKNVGKPNKRIDLMVRREGTEPAPPSKDMSGTERATFAALWNKYTDELKEESLPAIPPDLFDRLTDIPLPQKRPTAEEIGNTRIEAIRKISNSDFVREESEDELIRHWKTLEIEVRDRILTFLQRKTIAEMTSSIPAPKTLVRRQRTLAEEIEIERARFYRELEGSGAETGIQRRVVLDVKSLPAGETITVVETRTVAVRKQADLEDSIPQEALSREDIYELRYKVLARHDPNFLDTFDKLISETWRKVRRRRISPGFLTKLFPGIKEAFIRNMEDTRRVTPLKQGYHTAYTLAETVVLRYLKKRSDEKRLPGTKAARQANQLAHELSAIREAQRKEARRIQQERATTKPTG